ncbi:MAG TPA: PAS domain S-box protein [Methanomicrobiales archaeon]|jgi:PAS domain S-box-containing protein|nr:PAS domain S-box protein [Methanomicrobiales archaeon]
MAEQHRQTKDYFWYVVIFGTTGAALTATLVGLKEGAFAVYPHLYYFPIIIVSYLYPRRGTIFSVLLGGAYLFLTYAFAFLNPTLITPAVLAAGTVHFYVFVTVGFIASSLSLRLNESEAKFRDITENSPLGIYLTEKGKFRYVNPRFAEIHGYGPNELPDRMGLETLVHPDDWQVMREQFHQLDTPDAKPFKSLVRTLTKDGRTIWVEILGSRTTFQGRPAYMGTLLDVTELVQTRDALAESEARLRTLIESIGAGVLVVDPVSHIITDVNPAAAEMIGAPKSEIIGKVCHRFICPAEEKNCPVTDLGENIDHAERVLLQVDGNRRPIIKTVVPVNLGGKPYLLETFLDISERQKAEIALRESEKRYRTLFDSASDAIFIQDLSGHFLEVNRAACDQLGFTRDEFLQMNPRDIEAPPFKGLLMDWIDEVKNGGFLEMMRGGRSTFDTVHVRKDGSYMPVEISCRFIEFDNAPALLLIARDITERRKMEGIRALLASIVQSSEEAIISTELDGTVVSWNPGAESLFGYTDPEMKGQPMSRIVPPELHHEMIEVLERLSQGERIQHYETVRLRKDGSRVEVSLSVAQLKDANGQVIGTATIARDITQRKEAERALLAFINEAAMRLRHPVEIVHDQLKEMQLQVGKGEVTPEDLKVLLSVQIRNTEQIIENLNYLNRAILQGKKDIPESYRRYLTR